MTSVKKIIAYALSFLMLLSQLGFSVLAISDIQAQNLEKMLGVFNGTYTATQGSTGLTISVYKTKELIKDRDQLKEYAELANSFGYTEGRKLNRRRVKRIVKRHNDDFIAIIHFYPTEANTNVENGLYTAYIEYDEASGKYELTGDEWINHNSYSMVDFKNVTLSDKTLTGDVYNHMEGDNKDYGDMTATRESGGKIHSNLELSTSYKPSNTASDQYYISATVKNSAYENINNVTVTLDLPRGAYFSSGNYKEIKIDTVGSLDSETVTWNVTVLSYEDIQYSVTVRENNGAEAVTYKTISPAEEQDNTLSYSADVWDYVNSDPYFGNGYYINDEYYNLLSQQVSYTELERINDMLDDEWFGSCYGMVDIAALNKLGYLDPADYYSNADNLIDLPDPKDSDEIYSLTTYYHVTQVLDGFSWARYECLSLSESERVGALVSAVEAVKNGGCPVLMCFFAPNPESYSYGILEFYGHAILAYDIDYGNYSVKGVANRNKSNYDKRISIYDPNDNKNTLYMYINSDNTEWLIDGYCQNAAVSDDPTALGEGIFYFINDIEVLLPFNNSYTSTPSYDNVQITINTDAKLNVTAQYDDGEDEEFYIKGLEVSKEFKDDIVAYVDTPIGNGSGNRYGYILPDESRDVVITPDDGPIDLDMTYNYNGVSYSANITQGKSLSFTNGDTVTLDCDGDYSLSAVYDKPAEDSVWYKYTLEGNTNSTINLTRDENGNIVISNDDLANSVLKMTTVGNEMSREIKADTDSVMVKYEDGAPALYIDADGNGDYETLLDENGNANTNKGLLSFIKNPVIIAAAAGVGVITAAGAIVAIIVFIKKKNKYN